MTDTNQTGRGGRRTISVPFDDETFEAIQRDASKEERSLAGHVRFLVNQQMSQREPTAV